MSSIGEISLANQAMNSANMKVQILSETTKSELKKYGIDPMSVTSESQAQQLIEQKKAEVEKQEAEAEQKQDKNPSEQQLISDLKSLANKLGMSVSDDATVEDLVSDISVRLDAITSRAMNSNDKELMAEAESLGNEFEMLQAMASSMQQNQSMLNGSMNMLSMMNKMSLGL